MVNEHGMRAPACLAAKPAFWTPATTKIWGKNSSEDAEPRGGQRELQMVIMKWNESDGWGRGGFLVMIKKLRQFSSWLIKTFIKFKIKWNASQIKHNLRMCAVQAQFTWVGEMIVYLLVSAQRD